MGVHENDDGGGDEGLMPWLVITAIVGVAGMMDGTYCCYYWIATAPQRKKKGKSVVVVVVVEGMRMLTLERGCPSAVTY
jgi:hypothetical protein